MNDIPNKGPGSNIPQQTQKVEQVKAQEVNTETSATVQTNVTQEAKDLPKTDAVGQSLVAPPDNLESDLKILQENPKVAFTSLKYFDNAYAALKTSGHENPYEEAAAQMGILAKELS